MKNKKTITFNKVLEQSISRRRFLKNTIIFGASSFIASTGLTAIGKCSEIKTMSFNPVQANSLDTITIPEGFVWQRVISWGDPLWTNGTSFNQITRGDATSQSLALGDNNDGMEIFTKGNKTILVVNNEYTNTSIFHGNRNSKSAENRDDFHKSQAAHGVCLFEIKKNKNRWDIVKNSKYNRKITAKTPIDIVGPARGNKLLKTRMDPHGILAFGTWNNCGNGKTPWGTYLTCEENFNKYFSSSDKNAITKELKRYGVKRKDKGFNWARFDKRFDIAQEPNEANRIGYVVEIDPLNPNSSAKKLTALGRLKHENAEVVMADNKHIVVYMGDDERGEYLYKFVSKNKYNKSKNNNHLLENGSLFVAKFNDDGTGKWIELNPASTGMNQAEICIHTRIAASKVNATTMDRPEWVAANPNKAELYCALTNNKYRGIKPNAGGDAMPINAANPRKKNNYGQIVRWRPKNADHSAIDFEWNLFVLAGNPSNQIGLYQGSENITPDNMFNSPDGLKFDSRGGLWIQTDGDYTNKAKFSGMGNNQMLLANPYTGEIKRFLVGPRECEVTGLTWSTDKKTMFVGIQHPGENGSSSFPDGNGSLPRSSIIAISRIDGGMVEI